MNSQNKLINILLVLCALIFVVIELSVVFQVSGLWEWVKYSGFPYVSFLGLYFNDPYAAVARFFFGLMFLTGMPAIIWRNFWSFAAVYLAYLGSIVFAALWFLSFLGWGRSGVQWFLIPMMVVFVIGNGAYPLPFFFIWFVYLPRYRASKAA